MTKLLDQAIESVRKLSESEQDAAAEALFAHLSGDDTRYSLTPAQVADVARVRQELRDGKTQLVTDAEMAAFWKKYGL